jgi:transcriptional regulator with XRE-family HTH domain
MTYSDMLVYLRKRANLSQAELASRTGLTRSAISMYETGKRQPDLETFEILADFYNVDMNTLTGTSPGEYDLVFFKKSDLDNDVKAKLFEILTSFSPEQNSHRIQLIDFILTTDDKMIDFLWDLAERVKPSENK